MRKIAHPDKQLYEKKLRSNHQKGSVGATEILVKQATDGDSLWVALATDFKHKNLPKKQGMVKIELEGLSLKDGTKNLLIAQNIRKCK